MADPTEPRALTAALAAPAFMTKTGGGLMHAATRHVERWAPEAGADRIRPLRSLGFVDRLVAPWLEAAQRSASLRLFSQYRSAGMPERPTTQTSWLFPRPWYQDELDWMTAARQVGADDAMGGASPSMLTTRGTFVTPRATTMPTALYEYVAPSLSVAAPTSIAAPNAANAYSPLVPLAAVQAARMMQRAITPLVGANPAAAERMSPGLRAVLATMLERSATTSVEPTRLAGIAPELVTPPAPRLPTDAAIAPTESISQPESRTFTTTANELGVQRAQLVELQRVARVVAERELAVRQAQTAAAQPAAAQPATSLSSTTTSSSSVQRTTDELEARIAQRVAQRQHEQRSVLEQQRTATVQREQRLHEAARESAARDARAAVAATAASASTTPSDAAGPVAASRVPHELVQAMAALSPALASTVAARIAQQPGRAVQTIAELTDAM